jgi:putative ABC transport system substrate-binding protein
MDRREFLLALGGASWSLAAQAQQAGKLPTIGLLSSSTAAAELPRRRAFVQRLGELGWDEGRNIAIVDRAAGGLVERAGEIAAEFSQLNVDVMVMAGDTQGRAAKRAAPNTPIVMAAVADAVGSGLAASLARPGGNVTGLSVQVRDTAGKRIELLRQVVPSLHRLAIFRNSGDGTSGLERAAAQTAAQALGIESVMSEFSRADDIPSAIAALDGRADALYVCVEPLMIANRVRINSLALAARLPVVHSYMDNLEGGGLMSYGADLPDLYRRAADFVDKILRGTKPADIPFEQPTKFELAINLRVAEALGLTIAPALLGIADHVIE